MIPAIAVIGFQGSRRRFRPYLPIPLVIFWPLIGIAALGVGIVRLFTPGRSDLARRFGMVRIAIAVLCGLSGLIIDIRSRNGESVHIRLV